jgi:hypothetical protein
MEKKKAGSKKRSGRKREADSKQALDGILEIAKKSFSDTAKSFSEGTNKVTDILLDNSRKSAGVKARKIGKELVSTFEDIAGGLKSNFKNIKPADFLRGASYGTGKFIRIAKDTCAEIANDLME